ncbi:hypothetical protein BGZ52_011813 [Haplosporangium bisporale]|nr:hypothetical protein BGZ52_011813 [Haplosporangium bisporale]
MMFSNSNASSSSRFSDHSAPLDSADTVDNLLTPEYVETTVPIQPKRALPATLPAGPVVCSCTRHYKHAIISKVISMPLELLDSITRRWSDEKRHLEYSVSFKVPMLAKTSTACFETQQVTEYSKHVILIHSESRTPNVPYGEHFSTVNQICMTWDSPGKTKIQCFTEVRFKKSIMWSGKVEAGSLEGSGGFYKELIRQLAELADSPQGATLVEKAYRPNTMAETASDYGVKLQKATKPTPGTPSMSTTPTAATLQTEPVVSPLSITNEPATPIPNPDTTSYSLSGAPLAMEPIEMSRAQPLLSQQFLRSQAQTQPLTLTLPLKSGTRVSLDSLVRPKFEAVSTTDSTSSIPEKKSPVVTFIQSSASPVSPVVGMVGNDQEAVNSAASASAIEPSSAEASKLALPLIPSSAQTMLELMKKGLMLFYKTPSTTLSPLTSFQPGSIDSAGSLGDIWSRPITPPLASANSTHLRPAGNRVKFASTIYHTRRAIASERHHDIRASAEKTASDSASCKSATHQDRDSRRLSKTLFRFLVMGMAITALNIWQLFSVVSSMVEVVHIKQELVNHSLKTALYTRPRHSYDMISPMSPAMIQAEPEFSPTHSESVPLLREQTDLLRAEIVELFGLLEAARQDLKNSRLANES